MGCQGVIDPIEKMSVLALKYNVGLHVDCCLGGFVLPFAKKLGYKVLNRCQNENKSFIYSTFLSVRYRTSAFSNLTLLVRNRFDEFKQF